MLPIARRLARIEAALPAEGRDPFTMEVSEIEPMLAAEAEPVLVEDYGCSPGAGARFVASQIVQGEAMGRRDHRLTAAQVDSMLRRFASLDREGI